MYSPVHLYAWKFPAASEGNFTTAGTVLAAGNPEKKAKQQ